MKKRKSLPRILNIMQLIVFCLTVLFMIGDSMLLYKESMDSVVEERNMQVMAGVRETKTRIESIQQQIKEIIIAVMNNDGLWSENQGNKYFDKMQMQQLLAEKKSYYPVLEHLFVIRPDDFLMYQTERSKSIWERLEFKEYRKEHAKDLTTTQKDNFWRICDIANKKYACLIYYYEEAEIYVGMAISADQIFSELIRLFEDYQGCMGIGDVKENCYGDYEFQERSEWGKLLLEETPIGGGLSLSGYFTIDYFEIIKNNMIILILGIGMLCVASIFLQNLLLHKLVIAPITELAAVVKDAHEDIERISVEENARTEELYVLQKTLNDLFKEVVTARMQLYERKLQKQSMELRQLRAQLKPHFYLNAIMTVSSMTYQNRNEEIREYLNDLSAHMRYMMRISGKMVSLGEELLHIENYFRMQEIKFPDSVVLCTDCPEELLKIQIPHLLLYTIVENTFKYALNLSDAMVVTIQCRRKDEDGFTGVSIVVEDNGKGFEEETLLLYNKKEVLSDEEGKHIGLSNVKRSLALTYGRDDLLLLSNAVSGGARVELRIPESERN